MEPALPDVAVQFASAAERAMSTLGGIEMAKRAEVDESLRSGMVKLVLDALGVEDLDPRADLEAAAMAAELVRVAGRFMLPFPMAGYVMRRSGDIPIALASASPLRVDHGDLFARWVVIDVKGEATEGIPSAPPLGSRLAPFVTNLVGRGQAQSAEPGEAELLRVLSASYLLGVSERALELAVNHVKSRVQFGRPIAEFQGVRFGIADAIVGIDGLRELVRFSLWKTTRDPHHCLSDAVAAHFSAQEVGQSVLRLSQQLHGAAGQSDEYDISVLVRHAQPALRLPVGSDAMSEICFGAIETHGFETLFPLRKIDAEPPS